MEFKACPNCGTEDFIDDSGVCFECLHQPARESHANQVATLVAEAVQNASTAQDTVKIYRSHSETGEREQHVVPTSAWHAINRLQRTDRPPRPWSYWLFSGENYTDALASKAQA